MLISTKELDFCKAQAQFDRICDFLRESLREGKRLDECERGIFPQAMEMGLLMLKAFVEAHGDGDNGAEVERKGRTLRRLKSPRDKRYLSIFGELTIARYVYGKRESQAHEWKPLDAALGLPEGENSYVLEDWLQRLCVKDAYEPAVEDLRAWLGTTVSVRTAERINRDMGDYTDGYRRSQGMPSPEEDESLLVISADGKGVRMRRSLEQRLAEEAEKAEEAENPEKREKSKEDLRRATSQQSSREPPKDSDRPGKKQMAYVGAVYSIARHVRTADDVIDEVRRRKRSSERPQPVHKHLWAEMTQFREGELLSGTPMLFLKLSVEANQRDPDRQKTWVCLMDGERQLWNLQEEWLGRAIGILDLFHAMKRLWAVAGCLYAEKCPARSEFVTHHLRMLLNGKVGYVIRNFRKLLENPTVKSDRTKKETVASAITYYDNNREHMRYNIYMAAGYPIASGVIEGACHHFVQDRMEGSGMRWEIEGAQSMLSLRAIFLNGQWDEFIDYRIAKEQASLYGEETQTALAT